eukprot:gene2964-12971_t
MAERARFDDVEVAQAKGLRTKRLQGLAFFSYGSAFKAAPSRLTTARAPPPGSGGSDNGGKVSWKEAVRQIVSMWPLLLGAGIVTLVAQSNRRPRQQQHLQQK